MCDGVGSCHEYRHQHGLTAWERKFGKSVHDEVKKMRILARIGGQFL